MPDYPELLILRHGETEWNREGRMQGALDSPLTYVGRAQALAQGAALRAAGIGPVRWFSSPQGRALETARLASGEARVTADDRLREESQPHRHVDRHGVLDHAGVGGEAIDQLARLVLVEEGDIQGE